MTVVTDKMVEAAGFYLRRVWDRQLPFVAVRAAIEAALAARDPVDAGEVVHNIYAVADWLIDNGLQKGDPTYEHVLEGATAIKELVEALKPFVRQGFLHANIEDYTNARIVLRGMGVKL